MTPRRAGSTGRFLVYKTRLPPSIYNPTHIHMYSPFPLPTLIRFLKMKTTLLSHTYTGSP